MGHFFLNNRIKALSPFVLLMIMTLIIPFLVMIFYSFKSSSGTFSIQNYQTLLTESYYLKALKNSIIISLVASIISEIVSVLGAWSLSKLGQKFQNIAVSILNMVSSFAGVPLAFALIILFGNAGILNAISTAVHWNWLGKFDLYSWKGLILAYTFFEIPLGILFLFPTISGMKKEWREASLILGSNKYQYFVRIAFPILKSSILGTFVILFANAFGTYETVIALTGNNVLLLSTVIGSLISGELDPNIPLACAASILFAIITASLICLSRITFKNKKYSIGKNRR